MFCARCGRENVPLLDYLCSECYSLNRKVLKVPKEITITYCSSCGKYLVGKEWTDDLEPVLRRKLKFKGDITEFTYSLTDTKVHIRVKGLVEDTLEIELERDIKLVYKKRHCETCFSKLTGAYKAKVQLRGENVERALRFLDFRNVSKSGRVKGGADIFFSNMEAALIFASKIAKKFGSKVIRSKKLVGMREGQRQYKETLSVRI